MSKLLITALLLLSSLPVFALDADIVTFIHTKTKSAVIEKCKSDLPNMTEATCACLGDKSQANLDDSVLQSCPNDENGASCVKDAVEKATLAALSEDTMRECALKSEEQALPGNLDAADVANK